LRLRSTTSTKREALPKYRLLRRSYCNKFYGALARWRSNVPDFVAARQNIKRIHCPGDATGRRPPKTTPMVWVSTFVPDPIPTCK
jgi:hypothetical protein